MLQSSMDYVRRPGCLSGWMRRQWQPESGAYLPPPPAPVPPRIEIASPAPPPMVAARPASRLPSLHGKKIVIDAGHGGKDPGDRGVSRLPEKTIVLSVANEVARLLQDRGAEW